MRGDEALTLRAVRQVRAGSRYSCLRTAGSFVRTHSAWPSFQNRQALDITKDITLERVASDITAPRREKSELRYPPSRYPLLRKPYTSYVQDCITISSPPPSDISQICRFDNPLLPKYIVGEGDPDHPCFQPLDALILRQVEAAPAWFGCRVAALPVIRCYLYNSGAGMCACVGSSPTFSFLTTVIFSLVQTDPESQSLYDTGTSWSARSSIYDLEFMHIRKQTSIALLVVKSSTTESEECTSSRGIRSSSAPFLGLQK